MEQTNPRRRRTSARLAFADHVNRFVAGQRAPGSPKRTETLAGVNPPLGGPVVLLQDNIEVRHRPVLAAGVQRLTNHTVYGDLESQRFTAVNFKPPDRQSSLSTRDAVGHQ